ncbi:MAG: RNA polymerase sigma factor [Candidatus Limnocylindria bacterium]
MEATMVGVIEARTWEDLYLRLRPTLMRALAATSGSYEGVEDAIQDAFAAAMERDASDIRSPEAWLFVVANNRLRRSRRFDRLKRRLGMQAPRSEEDLDQALLRLEVTRKLLTLSPRDRELLVAKYYVGMTQEEIARFLKVPRGTVSAAVSRAAARYRGLEEER